MTELESIGAIIRRRERVAGMRGRGIVRYFINPRVASDGSPNVVLSPRVKTAYTIAGS
ncbi:hypothetical protein GCM10011404_32960 [Sphingomonas prati]|nr:hypothetical protein GCM10011404_32960 [Sphingomonas prati]